MGVFDSGFTETRKILENPAKSFRGAFSGADGADPEVQTLGLLTPEQEELLRQQIGSLPGRNFFTGADVPRSGTLSLAGLEESTNRRRAQEEETGTEGRGGREEARESFRSASSQTGRGARDEAFEKGVAQPLTEKAQERTKAISRGKSGAFFGSDREKLDTENRDAFTEALAREKADFELQGRAQDIQTLIQSGQGLSGISAQTNPLQIAQAQIEAQGQQSGTQLGFSTAISEAQRKQNADIQQQQLINQLLGIETKENLVIEPGESSEQQLLGIGGNLLGRYISS